MSRRVRAPLRPRRRRDPCRARVGPLTRRFADRVRCFATKLDEHARRVARERAGVRSVSCVTPGGIQNHGLAVGEEHSGAFEELRVRRVGCSRGVAALTERARQPIGVPDTREILADLVATEHDPIGACRDLRCERRLAGPRVPADEHESHPGPSEVPVGDVQQRTGLGGIGGAAPEAGDLRADVGAERDVVVLEAAWMGLSGQPAVGREEPGGELALRPSRSRSMARNAVSASTSP